MADASGEEAGFEPMVPTRLDEPPWVEPYPDALLRGVSSCPPGPDARVDAREAISLGFVTALQRLAPRPRAVLLLRDVLGYRADEVAEMLATSEASVERLLASARTALERCRPPARDRARPTAEAERELACRFAAAFGAGDVEAVVALFTEDAWLTMPPGPFTCRGREAIGRVLAATFAARPAAEHRLVATAANGQPGFGHYVRDPRSGDGRPQGLLVLTVGTSGITALTRFAGPAFLRRFGLPRALRW